MLLVGVRQFLIIGHLNQKLLTQMEIFRHGEIPKCAQSATTPDRMKRSHGHHTRRQYERHHRSIRVRHHVACADHHGGADVRILRTIFNAAFFCLFIFMPLWGAIDTYFKYPKFGLRTSWDINWFAWKQAVFAGMGK